MPASKAKEDWKKILTSEQYAICREKGTEPAFSGEFYDFKEKGQFYCICCSSMLFSSEAKFDSGTGWPSFYAPITEKVLKYHKDASHNMSRIEVLCSNCDSHLGHVFSDGPSLTRQRFCINSISLGFSPNNKNV